MVVSSRNSVRAWRGRASAPIRLAWRHPWGTAVAGGVLALAGLWAWWATQLRGLPDVGDPFDVAAFEAVSVPDEVNAFVEYREAASMTTATWRRHQAKMSAKDLVKFPDGWAGANTLWRDFLAESGPALAIWRAGSEKSDFLYIHPEGLSFHTLLSVSQELRMLVRLAILEGSRLEGEGDLAGAWGWYRAALRSSRHTGRHGFEIERLIGAALHKEASEALTRWAAEPRVDAPMLRKALDEVIAIDALTVPASEGLKKEYLVSVRTIGDPGLVGDVLVQPSPGEPADWCQDLGISNANKERIQAARVFLANDRERSVRLARLMTANWLTQVDKPPKSRSRLARSDPPIYEADPDAPPASRALPPSELSGWLDSSMLAIRHYRFLGKFATAVDRERARQARLVVHLADQLYRREHGGNPPPSPSALVGPYLKALPEGFDEPPPAGR